MNHEHLFKPHIVCCSECGSELDLADPCERAYIADDEIYCKDCLLDHCRIPTIRREDYAV